MLNLHSAKRRDIKKLALVEFGVLNLKSSLKPVQDSSRQDPKNYTDAVCDDVEQAKIAARHKRLRYFYLDAVS